MGRLIAKGQWEADGRKLAKWISFIAGVVLIMWSLQMMSTLVGALAAQPDRDVGMYELILVLVPFGLGATAVFPKIVPVVYEIIDRLRPKS